MIKKQVYESLADIIGETLKRDLSDITEKGQNPITFEFSVLATWLVGNNYIPEAELRKKIPFDQFKLKEGDKYHTLYETMVRFRFLKETNGMPLWLTELLAVMYYLDENKIIGPDELGKILDEYKISKGSSGIMEA